LGIIYPKLNNSTISDNNNNKMALRHSVPDFGYECVSKRNEMLPVFMAPPIVEFRPGADKEAVVAEILSYRCVQVTAAVGAGKSVKLPSLIQQATGGLVIHTVPSLLLANSLYEYVRTVSECRTYFVKTLADKLPDTGLVFMCNFQLALRQGMWQEGKAVPKGNVAIFLDESHESDGASEVLRNTTQALECVNHAIFSSATVGPSEGRPREAAGAIAEHFYAHEPVEEWELEDESKPWAPVNFDGHTLIFVDDEADTDFLNRAYNEHDMSVYRLTSKMGIGEFNGIMRALRNVSQGMCVILADYTYRSGFTLLGITRVIDTLQVRYTAFENGSTVYKMRAAYGIEVEQAFGRGARIKGSRCVMARPSVELQPVISVVEGLEVDAAAILYRMLGYRPPRRFMKASPFAGGKVPRNLCKAMQSPLSMRTVTDLVDWSDLTDWDAPPEQPVSCVAKSTLPTRPVSPDGGDVLDALERRANERVAAAVPVVVNPVMDVAVESESASSSGSEAGFQTLTYRDVQVRDSIALARRMPSGLSVPVVPHVEVKAPTPVEETAGVQFDESLLGSRHVRSASESSAGSSYASVSSMTEEIVRDDTGDLLAQLLNKAGAEVEARETSGMEAGKMVYFPGVETVSAAAHFPGGFESVERVLASVGVDVACKHWPHERRMAATRLAVDAYNDSLVEWRALKAVVQAFGGSFKDFSAFVDATVVASWLTGLSEKVTEFDTKVAAARRAMQLLQERGYVPMADDVQRESAAGARYLAQLQEVAAFRSDFSPETYKRAWSDRPLQDGRLTTMQAIGYHEQEARGTRKLIADGRVAAGTTGSGQLVTSRVSTLGWLKAEGPSVSSGGGRSFKETIAKAILKL